MRWVSGVRERLRGLVFRGREDAEMEEELRFHLEMEAGRLQREEGLDAQEARRRAAIAFGGVEKCREEVRDARGLAWLSGLSLDLKLGARMLVRYPGLTLVGALSMAVAIGVGAATFELVSQVAHPTLPLDQGDRVVGLHNWDAALHRANEQALHDFAAWREQLASVEELGAFRTLSRNLAGPDGSAEPLAVAEMTASGFRVARVPPLLGRHLVEDDERKGAAPVVVIGHGVWQSRFGGDPGVVGQSVRLGGSRATVVGVMPEGFEFPASHDLWMPLQLDVLEHPRGVGPGIQVFGRLAPGATLEGAQAELTTLGRRAAAAFPATHEQLRPRVMPYARAWSPYQGEGIPWGLLTAAGYSMNAAVVMFLLLVCANVATLVFARTATRESELVVRSALGASRRRIAMQLFAEALVLGGLAGVLGLAAATAGVRWGLATFEAVVHELPFWFRPGLSPQTVLYAGVLTVLGALVSGVLPALKATGRGIQGRLRQAAVGGSSLHFGRLWTGIIVTQVALTVAFVPLVVGAALEARKIRDADVGFPAEQYLVAQIVMGQESPMSASAAGSAGLEERFRAMYRELERRLEEEPGVVRVTFASHLPGAAHPRRPLEVEGGIALPSATAELRVQTAAVDPAFFDAFGAPIQAGRGFHSADADSSARVAIVNESFVREVLGGKNPVGRRVRYRDAATEPGAPERWYEIVGVVRQLAMQVDAGPAHAAGIYHPLAPGSASSLQMAVHLSGEPEAFAARLRAVAAAVDPTLRLHGVRPLDDARRDLLIGYTFWIGVAASAACVVLLLSTTGIYSLMAFTVARRTRDIGIRVALGADRRRIVAEVFSRAGRQVGIGILTGTLLLVALASGLGPTAPAGVLAAAVALMIAVCALACVVPTRRALRIQPTEALRADA